MGGAEGCEARLSDSGLSLLLEPMAYTLSFVNGDLGFYRKDWQTNGSVIQSWAQRRGCFHLKESQKCSLASISPPRSWSRAGRGSTGEAKSNLFIRVKMGSCGENYTVCAGTTHRKPRSLHRVSGMYTLLGKCSTRARVHAHTNTHPYGSLRAYSNTQPILNCTVVRPQGESYIHLK